MYKVRNIYKLTLLSAAMFLSLETSAQQRATLSQKSEIGGGIGTFNYAGDLVRLYDPSFHHLPLLVSIVTISGSVVSFRAGLTGGKLRASDKKHPIDAFASARSYSFNIGLIEAQTVFRISFSRLERFEATSQVYTVSHEWTGNVRYVGHSGKEW
ncbi:MAG: hypothetical protein WDO15_13255 [Bacteroidota bacterium]